MTVYILQDANGIVLKALNSEKPYTEVETAFKAFASNNNLNFGEMKVTAIQVESAVDLLYQPLDLI